MLSGIRQAFILLVIGNKNAALNVPRMQRSMDGNGVLSVGKYRILIGGRRCTTPPPPSTCFYLQLREKGDIYCMVVSQLWRGPGNVNGFGLARQSYRLGLAVPVCG